jgi:putative ABC transport system permease protein
MKNPLNSFINVFGLSLAIGICILFYSFAQWTYSTDQFHKNKNEVYLVTFFSEWNGTQLQHGQTPRPLRDLLKQDFTNIKKVCRVEDKNAVIKYYDNVFHERVRYVDPEFLDMLTFPLKWGTSQSLEDMNSIILSEEMAFKYFGQENPIGREMLMKFDKDASKVFKVTGVAEAFPSSRTIDFNFLINFENIHNTDPNYDFHDWRRFVNATLVWIKDPSELSDIERGMEKYITIQNEAVEKDMAISYFAMEPLATLHERADNIKNNISRGSGDNYTSAVFGAVIGLFLLLLACFNYINIAIVSVTKRIKEIGVRKTIGANQGILIWQFLVENLVITFFALTVGLIFGAAIFVPWFEQMNHFRMGFRLDDPILWIFIPAILLFTGVASGLYPALYISKFHVIGILKGVVRFGKKNPLTKTLLGFQLILACILITSAVMFTQNASYVANRSWGYNPGQVLYTDVPDQFAFEQLRNVMAQYPDVISVAGSSHHIGKDNTSAVIYLYGHQYEVDQLSTDENYFETMGLHLIAGRVFIDDSKNDNQAVVVNETFVKSLSLEQPVGQLFKIDSIQYEVIGVVKDFHSYNFSSKVRPTIFMRAEHANYKYLSLRVREGSEMQTFTMLREKWIELFPEMPFQGGYQEDTWGNYFEQISVHGRFWRAMAFIAVVLASLGLYGLVTLNVAGRIREFSIRKIFGAGLADISSNIAKQYVILFTIALIIGVPLSFFSGKAMFDIAYTYHMPINFSGVAIAVAILILVLTVTVSTQLRKVLRSNPVKGLRTE